MGSPHSGVDTPKWETELINSDCKFCENKKEYIEFDGNFYNLKKKFVIFISFRLGLNSLDIGYKSFFLELLNLKNNIGIIGGKGTKAIYILGKSEEDLIYLDPHYVQESDTKFEKIFENINTYKPKNLYTIPIEDSTSSITIGLTCYNINDFFVLIKQIESKEKLKEIIRVY